MKEEKILDLACGGAKIRGTIGLDKTNYPGVDVVHDLDIFPYPFHRDTFDKIICSNGIEHLEKPLEVLAEIYRICKNGALVKIDVPHFSSVNTFTDPTHKHAFSTRSFDYLVPGNGLYNLNYFKGIHFQKRKVFIEFWGYPSSIREFLEWFANKFSVTYERHFAFIFPANQLIFELEVVK